MAGLPSWYHILGLRFIPLLRAAPHIFSSEYFFQESLLENPFKEDNPMCGRFILTTPAKSLAVHFRLLEEPVLEPRYNIAPTQMVAVVQLSQDRTSRELKLLKWGLVPFWVKEPSLGARLINARAETVAEKPAFRASFKHKRCLIPADGFYEWKKLARTKQPYLYCMADKSPFAMAGLWDRWEGPDGHVIESVTVVTVEANELLRTVHERMPAIVANSDYDLWLDTSVSQPERMKHLLQPYPADLMKAFPVSTKVNRSDYDGPDLLEPPVGT
jgi:putative SOS response-associated peptidase YedK